MSFARQPKNLGSLSLVELSAGADRKPPTEFRLFKAGLNQTSKGPFMFDAAAAASVMEAFARHAVDVMIDYDHQVLQAGGGVRALAAGWGKLAVREGELWLVDCTWTPDATKYLGAGEYRYFSPLFKFDEDTRQVTEMVNCALTNTPAMDGIDALVAASRGEHTMTENEKALQDKDTEIARLNARVAELEAGGGVHVAALAATLGIERKAGPGAVTVHVAELARVSERLLTVTGEKSHAAALGAIEGWKASADEVTKIKAEHARAGLAACAAQIEAVLDAASKDGKIAPADRDEWKADAIKMGGGAPAVAGVEWLTAKVSKMTAINRSVDDPTKAKTAPNVDADSAKISATLGIKHAEYLAWRATQPRA